MEGKFMGEEMGNLFPKNERQEHHFVGMCSARPSDKSSVNISYTLYLKDSPCLIETLFVSIKTLTQHVTDLFLNDFPIWSFTY